MTQDEAANKNAIRGVCATCAKQDQCAFLKTNAEPYGTTVGWCAEWIATEGDDGDHSSDTLSVS